MLDAILFDLDGTLLPMDNDLFTKTYFQLLCEKAADWGYTDKKALIGAVWNGVKYMVQNDGVQTNYQVFWQGFSDAFGRDCTADSEKFDSFYVTDFDKARNAVLDAPFAAEIIRLARQKAKHIIIATNPIFPKEAMHARLCWIGLDPNSFDYITNYSNSHYAKPNPKYYEEIMQKFSLSAKNCLMIGNDVDEDLTPAVSLGMDFFLVTDHIINRSDKDIKTKHGDYPELCDFLAKL